MKVMMAMMIVKMALVIKKNEPEVAEPIQVVALILLQAQAEAQVVLETETVLAMAQAKV